MLEEKVDAHRCLRAPEELGARGDLASGADPHRSSPLL